MTPYAILLAKPTDTDETVRKLYHSIARYCHPDAWREMPEAMQLKLHKRWYEATEAYGAIKTAEARTSWEERQALLSGTCTRCAGSGVTGTRMFKGTIKLCTECAGRGRV